jgi:hypothetical protein
MTTATDTPQTDPQTDPNAPQTDPNAPATDPNAPATAPGTDGEKTEEKKVRAKAPDTTGITADDINAAVLAIPDLVSAAAPVRERSAEQKIMDGVAAKAYAEWIKAKKPSVWQKMPVVTYFLDAEKVPAYRYLIRRACAIVEPADGSTGVRVRFGNEFTLSEAMAKKIGKTELTGKTVLAWAAIDKREATDEKDKNPAVTAASAKHDATPKPDRPGKK